MSAQTLTFQWAAAEQLPRRVILHEDGWYWADVQADGCIDYCRLFNEPSEPGATRPPEDADVIHFCHLDDEIARLVRLRAAAIAYFGEDWVTQ